MKTTYLTAFIAAVALFASCAATVSLPDRLDKFVEKTELEYKNYTEEDWQKSRDEYDALVTEMKKNYDSYSTSDKVRMMKAMGKYGAMTVENEISDISGTIGDVSGTLGDVLESIPETINDMIEKIDTAAVRASVDSIKGSINDIIESIDTARLRKAVEGITQNIDTAKLREKIEALAKIFGLEE